MAGLTLAAALALAPTGCMITHETTVVRDQERVRVEFENDAAARIFYEALSKRAEPQREISKTKLEIPVVLEHTCKVETGPNAAFNRAVERCDTNRDGRITEAEARIYAEWVSKH